MHSPRTPTPPRRLLQSGKRLRWNIAKQPAKDSAKTKAGDQQKDADDNSSESAGKEQWSPDSNTAGDPVFLPKAIRNLANSRKAQNSNQAGSDGDNSSLADKLRDAISNLLAKMKPQSNSNQGQQRSASQPPGAQSGQKQNQSKDGASKSANQEQADANSGGESQGEQQQGGTDQPAQGKSQGNSNERPNSPDGKSGIGNQDGDKSAREAAELAAMGKISEIIGKRAANITGEVMVEVSSGKQQLKTEYSQKNATHVEAGGEINRDEIPLAYQQYVQQIREVRKLPAAKTKGPSRKKPQHPITRTLPRLFFALGLRDGVGQVVGDLSFVAGYLVIGGAQKLILPVYQRLADILLHPGIG